MMNNLLLPYRFKRIGWVLVIVAILSIPLLMLLDRFADMPWQWSKIITQGMLVVGLIALCLVTLSREKIEDEYIAALRSQTITLVFYLMFVVSVMWMISDTIHLPRLLEISQADNLRWFFIAPMRVTNIFTVFFIYIVIFNVRLWLSKRNTTGQN